VVRYREILKALKDSGLDFVVVGGIAAALHGSPASTLDLDVCTSFNEANVEKMLRALRPLHPRLRHHPDRMPLPEDPERLRGLKNLYLETDLGMIDLLGELPDVCTFDDLAGRTVEMDVGGFECRVLDLETLIRTKEVANRDKDRLALSYLRAIREARRTGPANE
jgi:predicted nucleotidyltransferase